MISEGDRAGWLVRGKPARQAKVLDVMTTIHQHTHINMTSRVEVFYTSILANPKVRSNTEKVERFLYKVPHQKYDIASMSYSFATIYIKSRYNTVKRPILSDG